jgi:hypothetical protein
VETTNVCGAAGEFLIRIARIAAIVTSIANFTKANFVQTANCSDTAFDAAESEAKWLAATR